ncbi:MAG: dihydropteroate synthase [Selenomonadaceae bacterium]|nr:dihydropteroate synthase [Selenomonadaceae bacterium]
MQKIFTLRGGKKISFGGKTLVMGIVNVTPDSFSDGGKFFSPENAIAHAKKLVDDGADILDIGAESTRPEAVPISVDEELSRLEKILPALKNFDVPISVDTYKPEVAAEALKLGADIINDVHGLEDSRMIDVAKKFDAPVVAMHCEKCCDVDIVEDVKKFLRRTLANCAANNFDTTKIIFDPGIGFGKTQEENLTLIRRLDELKFSDEQELSLLIGVSRKSFIGWATGLELDERDAATGALSVWAITKGVDIGRVHNVELIRKMCLMIDKLRGDF